MARAIIDAIQTIAGTKGNDEIKYIPCTVISIDEPNRICACIALNGVSTAPFSNVQLMASIDDGCLYIPAIDSTVLVVYSKYNQPFIAMYSELDKILFISGSSSLQITDGNIQLNDGSLGGLPKVEALTTKLNNIENLLNDLITKFNTHTHVLALSTGTGTAAPTAAPETGTLTPTEQSDIENTTITHGI